MWEVSCGGEASEGDTMKAGPMLGQSQENGVVWVKRAAASQQGSPWFLSWSDPGHLACRAAPMALLSPTPGTSM